MEGLKLAGEAIQQANAKLFLAFHPVQMKKQTVNEIKAAIITFGDAPQPVALSQGATARTQVDLKYGYSAKAKGQRTKTVFQSIYPTEKESRREM
jgi:hypothetical protein